jgi:hypothetical protein
MTKPASSDPDFESPRPAPHWAVRYRLASVVTALIVLALVQVVINHVLCRSRRAAVGTHDASVGDLAPAPAMQTSTPLPALDPNAPLLTWDAATGTWKAQRLGDPQPAPPVAQGVAYTDGYYDMQLGRFVPGTPPSATVAGTPSPDYQSQRRVALQQQIVALEAQIESDGRRVNGLGILGQGFGKVPDVVRAKPPENRGEALAGAVAEVLASSLSNQAGQEQAEAQARIDANRRSLQELRSELAGLGR